MVAPDLIGALLTHRLPDGRILRGRIVEVEAYLGDGRDPASHSHRGETARNQAMFGPPGRLYAYRSYGVHTCANVVCGSPGHGEAVLLRALEPVSGERAMRAFRGLGEEAPVRKLACGPGRLAQAMGITLGHDGVSLLRGPIALHAPASKIPASRVEAGPRVGITRAETLPLRFLDPDSAGTSPFRAGRRRKEGPAKERRPTR